MFEISVKPAVKLAYMHIACYRLIVLIVQIMNPNTVNFEIGVIF